MKPPSVVHLPSRVLLASLILSMSAISTQAQNETNNWIFGSQAWLKFPGGSGSPVTSSGAVINTQEGSSSISDQAGNLLFSTDGRFVWNRNNVQMPAGFGLLGASSATQSALIVPWPDNECRRYIIFTVDDMAPGKQQQLNYSVVDMNATTGGGLGDVITKNVLLKKDVSEKLAAVRNSSGTGFWVVAHGFKQPGIGQPNPPENREFYAYPVTATGVGAPIVSTAGTAHQNTNGSEHPSSGQMKISPDGRLIACAVNTAFVEILDFNAGTGTGGGTVTQGPPRTFPSSSPPFQQTSVYGLEFSPNSGFLYVTTLTAGSRLFQYNISSPGWTLLATGTAASTNYDIGQLQLGPDNRIYVARDTRIVISVINSPSLPGTSCAFAASGPVLIGGNCKLGLPTMLGGQFSCGPGPTVTPTPTVRPSATPTLTPRPSATPTPPGTPTPTPDPCCPPWNKTLLGGMMIYRGSGGISDPYTLEFVPSTQFSNSMQTYLNYLHAQNSAITAITVAFKLHNQGTGTNPSPPYGPQIPATSWATWNWSSSNVGIPTLFPPGLPAGPPTFFAIPPTPSYPMAVNTWYMVHTGIYLENGQRYFPESCAEVDVYINVRYMGIMKGDQAPVLEISDGKTIIRRIPLEPEKKK